MAHYPDIEVEPTPCTVDGKPALIIGYGSKNGSCVIDYRFVGETATNWVYGGSPRIQVEVEQ